MKIIYIGDIFGSPGRDILLQQLPLLKEKYKPNLIFINGENAAHGSGITKKMYKEFMQAGVSMITMGNHTFGNNDIYSFIDDEKTNIIRPINYHKSPGVGYKIINYNDKKILLINALGRAFMECNIDNPFIVVKQLLETIEYDYSIVDFHAESTAEKISFALYFDGILSAVVGTHTHIPTADNRMLPKGTLYITDLGMTGPLNGSIGLSLDSVLPRLIDGVRPLKREVATGPRWLNGVFMDLDKKTIERINIREE